MNQRKWTDQEILDALRYWALRHGRSPKWADWTGADPERLRPTNVTVWTRCGGWTDALIMAGLEPNVPKEHHKKQRFSRIEARRLRREGLTDKEIGEQFGVTGGAISRAIGKRKRKRKPPPPPPQPRPPRKPRNAAERREARIAALKRALEDG